jgi:hypothetical protein
MGIGESGIEPDRFLQHGPRGAPVLLGDEDGA